MHHVIVVIIAVALTVNLTPVLDFFDILVEQIFIHFFYKQQMATGFALLSLFSLTHRSVSS